MAPWMSDQTVRQRGALILWEGSGSGRFRDIDHQDPPPAGDAWDWFPGLPALERRFGAVIPLPSVLLSYPDGSAEPPVELELALVPPAQPCP